VFWSCFFLGCACLVGGLGAAFGVGLCVAGVGVVGEGLRGRWRFSLFVDFFFFLV